MQIRTARTYIVATTLFLASTSASAALIDFEGFSGYITNTGEFFDVGDYRFTLSTDISGSVLLLGQSSVIEPNTNKLFSTNHSEISMSRVDGGLFDLNSLDIAGSWVNSVSWGRWADHVDLIAGSNSFTATLAGMPATYQNISPNFSNISSVLFQPFVNANGGSNNYEFVIDNIDVNASAAVPEPATLALFGIGLAGLGFARKKKKSA